MILWLEKHGSVLLIVLCALVVLFSALYTRQDDLKRAAAKNAAADQSDDLDSLPLFRAPVASLPTHSYRGVFKSESGLWQLDPYVRYNVKKGDRILSPCSGSIEKSTGQTILIHAENDLVFSVTGDFECSFSAPAAVAAGQEIARCLSSGTLLFGLSDKGEHVDPLAYLTPGEVK